MVTYNRIRVMIALTVAASFGWVTMRDRSLADEPRDSTAPPAASSAPPERYLLLTNGQLIKGVISERETDYQVGQRIGAMSFPKRRVEGAFDSIADAYQYRVKQLPERDTEERMKLALWCLNLKLKAQAKEQLTKVIELNPQHTQAKAMLFSMQQAAELASQRLRDPDVQQAAAETSRETRPGALDSAVIQNAQRGLGVSGLPVIFDLPAPLAVRRANEYFRLVHPLLQAYCARCHDGNYDGQFQLIPMKNRADRNPGRAAGQSRRHPAAHRPRQPRQERTTLQHASSPRPRPAPPADLHRLERQDLPDSRRMGAEPSQHQERRRARTRRSGAGSERECRAVCHQPRRDHERFAPTCSRRAQGRHHPRH